jgi:hypothetical protein
VNDSDGPPSAPGGTRSDWRELISRSRLADWWPLLLFTIVGLAATIIGAWQIKWSDALWLEVAKSGIQVVAVGVLGGALAATWRTITSRREAAIEQDAKKRDRKIERNEKILTELASMVALYNDVKAVRRILRSLGLDLKTYPNHEGKNRLLTKEQAAGFHEQMLILSRLQLGFEWRVRQFGASNFLDSDTGKVVENLGSIENHLNGILDLWEQRGWTIREGTPLGVVSDGLVGLFRVRGHLRPGVSAPLSAITGLVNKHVFGEFGEASKETQKAVRTIDAIQDERGWD